MREQLSIKYILGTGLEIAAFHNPWPIYWEKAHVIYLDCMTNHGLRRQFPEVAHKPLVDVHVIDDAQYLGVIPDESMDFVISSHVFEHMEDAAGALFHWLRVLKKDKPLVMAIPLKDNFIDKTRTPTTLSHVVDDFSGRSTPARSAAHYREYFRDGVDQFRGEDLERAITESVKTGANIHFHCWNFDGLWELFDHFQSILSYKIELIQPLGHEVFVVLRKL